MNSILEILRRDHRRMQAELNALANSDFRVSMKRNVEDLCVSILLHLYAEEQTLYADLQMDSQFDIRELGFEGAIEHSLLEHLLGILNDFSPQEERWHAAFAMLRATLSEHNEDEEYRVFPQIERRISKERQKFLGTRFRQLQLEFVSPSRVPRWSLQRFISHFLPKER